MNWYLSRESKIQGAAWLVVKLVIREMFVVKVSATRAANP